MSPTAIAKWLEENSLSLTWLPVRQAVRHCLGVNEPRLSEALLDEEAEKLVESVTQKISERSSEFAENGRVYPVEIDFIHGYVRRSQAQVDEGLERIKEYTPRQFEELCAAILRALGGSTEVTKQTCDGGIDFVGTRIKRFGLEELIPEYASITVIGQAKRYLGQPISEQQLREFVGAATRKKQELRKSHIVGALSPVIFAFWTTSNFQSNADSYARDVGLWTMDGLTLSKYACELNVA